jgi:hypothetical protein
LFGIPLYYNTLALFNLHRIHTGVAFYLNWVCMSNLDHYLLCGLSI